MSFSESIQNLKNEMSYLGILQEEGLGQDPLKIKGNEYTSSRYLSNAEFLMNMS